MRITIQRYKRRTGFLDRRPVFVLALGVILSNEEEAAIKERNLYRLTLMDRPFHPLWKMELEDWLKIQALPVGLLTYLHRKQRVMDVAYFENDFDAEGAERQLRKNLTILKAVIDGSEAGDRLDEFEL